MVPPEIPAIIFSILRLLKIVIKVPNNDWRIIIGEFDEFDSEDGSASKG